MSFKKVPRKSKFAAVAKPADPAMPSPIPAELLNTVGSEVSKESAPLLEFIVRHMRLIGLAIVVLVVILVGYGGYRWWEAHNHAEGLRDLGKIVVSGASPEQLQNVLAFAEQGPSSVRTVAYFEAARIAAELDDKVMGAEAWGKVAQAGGSLGIIAQVNQAQLFQASGNAEGAARLYASIQSNSGSDMKNALLSRTALAWMQAAGASETARIEAVRAYEQLLATAGPQERVFFQYCLDRLQSAQ